MELSVTKEQSTSAEIRWTLQTVLKGFSNNSANNVTALFKAIFPDSPTAQFSLGADKLRYVMVHGITPYCYEMLKKEVGASDFYTVMFDESLSSVTQSSQMDISGIMQLTQRKSGSGKQHIWVMLRLKTYTMVLLKPQLT